MVPDWLVPQIILSGVGVVFVLWLRHRYRVTISLKARRKEYQYLVFSLRDQAIRMVVNKTVSEDNESWQRLYSYINDTAKIVRSDKFFSHTNGLRFFAMLLKSLPEPPQDLRGLEHAPKQVRQLWVRTASGLLAIAWDGNVAFRWCFHALFRMAMFYRLIMKTIPDGIRKYTALQDLVGKFGSPVPG